MTVAEYLSGMDPAWGCVVTCASFAEDMYAVKVVISMYRPFELNKGEEADLSPGATNYVPAHHFPVSRGAFATGKDPETAQEAAFVRAAMLFGFDGGDK